MGAGRAGLILGSAPLPWPSPSPAQSPGMRVTPSHALPSMTVFSGRREAVRSLPGSVGWCWAPFFLLHRSPDVGVPFLGLLES